MDGKTYLNYIRNRIHLVMTASKLFLTGHIRLSEMVATDRKENNGDHPEMAFRR